MASEAAGRVSATSRPKTIRSPLTAAARASLEQGSETEGSQGHTGQSAQGEVDLTGTGDDDDASTSPSGGEGGDKSVSELDRRVRRKRGDMLRHNKRQSFVETMLYWEVVGFAGRLGLGGRASPLAAGGGSSEGDRVQEERGALHESL